MAVGDCRLSVDVGRKAVQGLCPIDTWTVCSWVATGEGFVRARFGEDISPMRLNVSDEYV
jgi:hypothetical protein